MIDGNQLSLLPAVQNWRLMARASFAMHFTLATPPLAAADIIAITAKRVSSN